MSHTSIDQPRISHLSAIVVHIYGSCLVIAMELRNRRAVKDSLVNLSSRHLRDIGLINSDIETANSASLSHEVATEIQIKARLRSANW